MLYPLKWLWPLLLVVCWGKYALSFLRLQNGIRMGNMQAIHMPVYTQAPHLEIAIVFAMVGPLPILMGGGDKFSITLLVTHSR